jgi:hypothetical protein
VNSRASPGGTVVEGLGLRELGERDRKRAIQTAV